jgi:anti-sigma regulatory factor (Ser/Thr protein kinase)
VASAAVDRDEQVMFLLSAARGDAVRDTLGDRLRDITYVDMDEHGRNPARLCTLLDGFRSSANGRRCVGVQEPVLGDQPAATLEESRFGESVLNSPALQSWNVALLCLYDTSGLDEAGLTRMRESHPSVHGEEDNPVYDPGLAGSLFAEALPGVPSEAQGCDVLDRAGVGAAREFVRSRAGDLTADRREDLVLAANEVMVNSLQHGGGQCRLAVWTEDGSVVCDVQDAGHIADPLVGRLRPRPDSSTGRGLWLANHLCDLVQIRSSQAGTTVRLRIER